MPETVTPKPGTSVKSLKEFTFTFAEDVDAEPGAMGSLAVGFGRYFATAPIEKVDSRTYTMTFNPIPTEEGDYTLTINEGVFFDSVNAADSNEGRMNAELTYVWSMGALVDITSTIPENDSSLGEMPPGYRITVNTSDNRMVSMIELEMTETEEGGSTEKTVARGESESKDAGGAIYWEVSGETITLYKDRTYTIYYSLYNAVGDCIKMATITFTGLSEYSGVGVTVEDSVPSADIYNLMGLPVGNDPSALPSGLYIIGVRKVVIR